MTLPVRSEIETIEQITCDLCDRFVRCARFWVARCQVHFDVCAECLAAAAESVGGSEE
jgi:hypothetical protein